MTDHLTEVLPPKFSTAHTYPGMASWAGWGPEGMTCRQCRKFKSPGYYSPRGQKGGGLRPGKCSWANGGMKTSGQPFPHDAKACNKFVENDDPQPPFSGGRF